MQIQPVSLLRQIKSNFKTQTYSRQCVKPLQADSVHFSSKFKGYTGWLEFPSCNKDSEGYYEYVSSLSKYLNSSFGEYDDPASILRSGDFHVYLVNDEPKIGVRFSDIDGKNTDVVKKIYSAENNELLPVKYLSTLNEHLKGYKIGKTANQFIYNSEKLQNQIDEMFADGIENYSFEEKLNAFGIETTLDENNKLVLSEYRQPAKGISFSDIGINEDELLQNTSVIMGNADFTYSDATSLGSVKLIGGDIVMVNHKVKDLGELAHIGGERTCDDSDFHINFEIRYGIW